MVFTRRGAEVWRFLHDADVHVERILRDADVERFLRGVDVSFALGAEVWMFLRGADVGRFFLRGAARRIGMEVCPQRGCRDVFPALRGAEVWRFARSAVVGRFVRAAWRGAEVERFACDVEVERFPARCGGMEVCLTIEYYH